MNIRTATIFLLALILPVSDLPANETSPASAADAARGLIERVIPQQANDFVVETIPADNGHDVFEIEGRDGKIVLRGNDGVSIASALNWYLKNNCHCDISWNCGDQLNLPNPLPSVPEKLRVVSPHQFRYAYNFCTYGYTMAWWDWPQWQRELDYLALNGINLALVIEGQESTWIQTFANVGYSSDDIRRWVVDPAHFAWFEMDNMESYGGPLSEELVKRRLALGQQILTRMRELGIEPVLPGYVGMVPPDFQKRFPDAKVLVQGNWNQIKRPDVLNPIDPMFAKVAEAYYSAQKQLFGGANFYDADPFHEGGSTRGVDIPAAGRAIFNAMNGATWVLQSWEKNPRQEMIDGLDKNKLLVLDLFCEKQENWRLRNNFNGTPWLWCAVNIFGGNTGMDGRLAWMSEGPVKAMNDPNKGRMSGIGALMEGSQTTPVSWEYFFEDAWRSTTPDLPGWLNDYTLRRYGATIPAAEQAWAILADTIYNAPAAKGHYPINSVVCALPSLNPGQRARGMIGTKPYYDTTKLAKAWELLIAAAPDAGLNDPYRYDLCDLGRQVLANLGTRYNQQIIAAYQAKDADALRDLSSKMLGLIRDMDTLVGTRREFLLGTWLSDARAWGATDEEKNLCERNARELITVWTSHDNITDYSNRQWNGLLGNFYYHRWEMWLGALTNSLAQGKSLDESTERAKIRDWELSWTMQHDSFPTQPSGDTIAISKALYVKYAKDAGP